MPWSRYLYMGRHEHYSDEHFLCLYRIYILATCTVRLFCGPIRPAYRIASGSTNHCIQGFVGREHETRQKANKIFHYHIKNLCMQPWTCVYLLIFSYYLRALSLLCSFAPSLASEQVFFSYSIKRNHHKYVIFYQHTQKVCRQKKEMS